MLGRLSAFLWVPYFHGQNCCYFAGRHPTSHNPPKPEDRSSHFGSRRVPWVGPFGMGPNNPNWRSLGDLYTNHGCENLAFRPSSEVDFWICIPKVWWRQLHGSRSTRECAGGIFFWERDWGKILLSPFERWWKVREIFPPNSFELGFGNYGNLHIYIKGVVYDIIKPMTRVPMNQPV